MWRTMEVIVCSSLSGPSPVHPLSPYSYSGKDSRSSRAARYTLLVLAADSHPIFLCASYASQVYARRQPCLYARHDPIRSTRHEPSTYTNDITNIFNPIRAQRQPYPNYSCLSMRNMNAICLRKISCHAATICMRDTTASF